MNNFQNQNYNQQENQNNQQAVNSHPQNQPNSQPQTSPLMQIVGVVLPSLIEHFTGQKMTTGGSGPEMQLVFSQILSIQQQILTNQQSLNQRLIALESNATQQFTNLVQQVQSIKSIRLTHQKETKAIDLGLQQEQSKEY